MYMCIVKFTNSIYCQNKTILINHLVNAANSQMWHGGGVAGAGVVGGGVAGAGWRCSGWRCSGCRSGGWRCRGAGVVGGGVGVAEWWGEV